jgi:uncharacterized protein
MDKIDSHNLYNIDSLEKLQSLSGELSPASTLKEINYLHPLYQKLIAASPFLTIATCGKRGLDVSPRGDPAGFVQVQDAKTLLLPERRGNNRMDTLRNIVEDPRVALLFMIPGIGETLRVNGRATISVDPILLSRFLMGGKPPKCVLVIAIDTVFFQCARAIQRSRLWGAVNADAPRLVPTAGEILTALTNHTFDGASYDRELPARQRATLY